MVNELLKLSGTFDTTFSGKEPINELLRNQAFVNKMVNELL